MVETKQKFDVVTTVGLVGGAAALGLGAWMLFKKPPGVNPGGLVVARFLFDYRGEGGSYILQVSFGHIRIVAPWFDHIEGMTWDMEVELEAPVRYIYGVECPLPMAVAAGQYDAEALIRLPGSHWLDYVDGGQFFTKSAINVKDV